MSTPELETAVQQWLSYDPNPKTREEVKNLYDNKEYKVLADHFLPRIAFGTAGLRSRMDWGYKNMNELVIIQTTQGLGQYILQTVPNCLDMGVAIGYDARHNSKTFAYIATNVLLHLGFKVYLFNDIACTPHVPFAVTTKGCAAGIMVTASHNPKFDNGYKVYWSNGVQIIPPTDGGIADSIQKHLVPQTTYAFTLPTNNERLIQGEVMENIIEAYYQSIFKECHFVDNSKAQLQAVFTPMHGVGARFTERALQTFGLPAYIPVVEQIQPDPEFPTVSFPNPEEPGALDLAMATADKNNVPFIIANDPDADRLAVAVKNPQTQKWVILSGNHIAVIFADWTFYQWKKKHGEDAKPTNCIMLASTVSSKALQAMANAEGFTFEDTLTGFKWIGNAAKAAADSGKQVLVAYEVELGYITGHTSFDKDGVRTAAAMYELANYWYTQPQPQTLLDRLEVFYAKYGYFKMVNSYFFANKEQIHTIAANLRNFSNRDGSIGYPTSCGEFVITSTRDVTLGKDTKYEDGKARLPLQDDTEMLTFTFENGATCTIRNSGTEPKLKYYVEVVSKKSEEDADKLLKTVTRAVIDNFINPQKYQLISKEDNAKK